MSYVYITSERAGHDGAEHDLFTVGFYEPESNQWQPDSDHASRDEAAKRVRFLNGGDMASETTESEQAHAVLDQFDISRSISRDAGKTWDPYTLAKRVEIVCRAMKMIEPNADRYEWLRMHGAALAASPALAQGLVRRYDNLDDEIDTEMKKEDANG